MADLAQRVQAAEHQLKALRSVCIGQWVLLLAVAAAFLASRPVQAGSPNVLHARGLVIEDSAGRARIVLGAPFPQVAGRKRQDEGSVAMVFLNEDGADRLLLGEGIGAQIDGKVYSQQQRATNGAAYGVTIMDGHGNERGGFGFIALASGGGRGIITLDRPVGDAWGAWVDDRTDLTGMTFNYPMPIGEYQPAIEFVVQKGRPFLHLKDHQDYARAELSLAADGKPSLTVSDGSGKQLDDLFAAAHH